MAKENNVSKLKEQRLKIAASMGINEKTLPPITSRKIAIYHSFEMGGVDPLVRESIYAQVLPPSAIIEGTFNFRDPNEDNLYIAQKLIKNVSRLYQRPVLDVNGNPTGASELAEEIEPIIFDGGSEVVNIEEEFAKYVFLELHPMNKNGKFRSPSGPWAFYRHDLTVKGRGVTAILTDLSADAVAEIRGMKDQKEIIQLASSVPNGVIAVDGQTPADIRRAFQTWAYQNPKEFFMLHKNHKVTVRLTVAQALDWGLLTHSHETRTFFLEGQLEFFTYDVTDLQKGNPVELMIDFLNSKEGEVSLEILEQTTGYWN